MGRKRKEIPDSFIDLGMKNKKHRARCKLCKSEFEVFRLDTHKCNETGPQQVYDITGRSCNLCGVEFSSASNARKHQRNNKCSKSIAQEINNGQARSMSTAPNLNMISGGENSVKSTNMMTTTTPTNYTNGIQSFISGHGVGVESTNTVEPQLPRSVYVVVDTNVFLHYISTIEDLLARGEIFTIV